MDFFITVGRFKPDEDETTHSGHRVSALNGNNFHEGMNEVGY